MKVDHKRLMLFAESFVGPDPVNALLGDAQARHVIKRKAARALHDAAMRQAEFLKVVQVANQARFIIGTEKRQKGFVSFIRGLRVRILQNIQNFVEQIAIKRHDTHPPQWATTLTGVQA